MKIKIFRFKVKFTLTGILEIEAAHSVEAEEIVKEMSDHEIEYLTEYRYEDLEILEEPELIEEI